MPITQVVCALLLLQVQVKLLNIPLFILFSITHCRLFLLLKVTHILCAIPIAPIVINFKNLKIWKIFQDPVNNTIVKVKILLNHAFIFQFSKFIKHIIIIFPIYPPYPLYSDPKSDSAIFPLLRLLIHNHNFIAWRLILPYTH